MASNMEVDNSSNSAAVDFHPLAIVHMSDQYTRVTTGGSPLPKDAPVVGLLFGTTEKDGIQIIDADDIPVSDTAMQVSLHQAVFPQHKVVGWYRVSKDSQPTAEDLATTQQLAKTFGEKILFCFLQVTSDKETLPITLFELDSNVLVGLEGWKVETSEAEKIAVEKVVRELPQSKNHSAHATNVSSIGDALEHMKERLGILIQFLEDTTAQEIPYDPILMRQAQQIVCELGPLLASAPTTTNPTSDWLSHLAVTTKTVQIIQGYTEKFRLVQENPSSSRDPRRF